MRAEMAFEAWIQDREGTYYVLKGEGGTIHVWRQDGIKHGLGEAFTTVGEAISAANEDSQERDGGGIDADSYDLISGDDTDYWDDD
jgi:hypothetical protein